MKKKVCIVMSTYNKDITNKLYLSAKKILQKKFSKLLGINCELIIYKLQET